MVAPIKLAKDKSPPYYGEPWNAFVELVALSSTEELTPVQRIAHLAFWYSSEVNNGGHMQYFGNKEYVDHLEVVTALEVMKANCQAIVLKEAWLYEKNARESMPEGYEEYLAWDEKYGYTRELYRFDEKFYKCIPELETDILESYLKINLDEFVVWVG